MTTLHNSRYEPIQDTVGIEGAALSRVVRLTVSTVSTGGVTIDFVPSEASGTAIDANQPLPLIAEEYPVLAAIWAGDEDDDIFSDEPAV